MEKPKYIYCWESFFSAFSLHSHTYSRTISTFPTPKTNSHPPPPPIFPNTVTTKMSTSPYPNLGAAYAELKEARWTLKELKIATNTKPANQELKDLITKRRTTFEDAIKAFQDAVKTVGSWGGGDFCSKEADGLFRAAVGLRELVSEVKNLGVGMGGLDTAVWLCMDELEWIEERRVAGLVNFSVGLGYVGGRSKRRGGMNAGG